MILPIAVFVFGIANDLIKPTKKNVAKQIKPHRIISVPPSERKDITVLSWKYSIEAKVIIAILDAYEYNNTDAINLLKKLSIKYSIPEKTIGEIIIDNKTFNADTTSGSDLKFEDL